MATFPTPGTPPAYFSTVTPSVYDGLFYSDETPTFTLSAFTSGTTYTVVNYYGATVASGTATSSTLTLPGTLPLGYYRLYLQLASGTDVNYGTSAGDCGFSVSRRNALLPPRPPQSQSTSPYNSIRDNPAQGWAAIGPVRYYIADANNLAGTGGEGGTSGSLTGEENDLAYAANWYLNPSFQDTARPRPSFLQFPNNSSPITAGQVAGITSVASTMFPLGITYFEGPRNEPTLNTQCATDLLAFYNAVKAGNASAKVLGPCPVGAGQSQITALNTFLTAGGASSLDEFSFHLYSMINGDLTFGRAQLTALTGALTAAGVSKPLWMTEWSPYGGANGVYNPRVQAQQWMLALLLLEQFGIPKERTQYFYGVSHGFWGDPSFYRTSTPGVTALPALCRVYSEEVYGKTYTSRITFPAPYDDCYIANLFTNGTTGDKVLALSTVGQPSASITFTLSGATSATLIDPWGNTSTVAATGGKIAVPVSELPSYLRLPSGVTATLSMTGAGTDFAAQATGGVASTNGAATNLLHLNDGNQHVDVSYGGGLNGTPWTDTTATFPTLPQITFQNATRIDTALIWAGPYLQGAGTLLDFDVQTSVDGTTWVTQATITRPAATTVAQASGTNTFGCTYEEFFDGQWVFPITFSPVTIKAIRLNVRSATYGGAYNLAAHDADPGINLGPKQTCIRRFAALCQDTMIATRVVTR